MRVLIVDHHYSEREILKKLLLKLGDVEIVGEAENCSDTVRLANEKKPDLIISEIKLPDGNCLESMKAILSDSPEVKIVILTTNESEEFLLQAIQNGARGYLIKDAGFESMLSALKKLNQDDFIVSPKIAQTIFLDYSRIRLAFDRQLDIEPLTARERDVLRLLCVGSSNREIARSLVISENTVRVHLQSIFKKLSLKNRREAREKYWIIFRQNNSPGDIQLYHYPNGFVEDLKDE